MNNLEKREKAVRDYFAMWLTRDAEALEVLFADTVKYEESTGTEYHGLDQMRRWFSDWNRVGEVLRWDVTRFSHSGCTTFVEWYFECLYENNRSCFDGVSIVEFSDSGKIYSLREFAAQHERNVPYGN